MNKLSDGKSRRGEDERGMADYIYLLENRLSRAQRSALRAMREVARTGEMTVFLVGGAVRDLTSGSPVRDLDVAVQGNALKLREAVEQAGGVITGESEVGQALFAQFPGNVRMEIGSTLSVTFPKPGKPVTQPASILEDLRRRDFTANAMALSLNEGSYGLLMDPVNGVADIENRELRLVSNYGFIEDPVRMIRAARLMARLGWVLDEKTQARYETGKNEGYISALSDFHRGYETEEIFHEEDPLRVLKRLESEGWMQHLAPSWTSAKVNVAELDRLREVQTQLQMQGIQPDTAAANFPLLVAKLSAKEVEAITAGFPRPGFVDGVKSLEGEAKELGAQLGGKSAALPSQSWRLLTSAKPEVVLWLAYSSKSPALQAKFKSFFTEWPAARQKMPYTLMQEMRITPELPEYEGLLEKLFYELMDGRLTTPEEMKAFLEPYSPPAPPPPVSLRRARAAKKDAKPSKARAKKGVAAAEEAVAEEGEPSVPEPVPVPAGPEPAAVARPKAAPKTEEKPVTPTAQKTVAKAVPKTAEKPVTPVSQKAVGEAATSAPSPVKPPAKKIAEAVPVAVAAKGSAATKTGMKTGGKAAPETQAAKTVAKEANKTASKAAEMPPSPAKKTPAPAAKGKAAPPAKKSAGAASKSADSAAPAKKKASR